MAHKERGFDVLQNLKDDLGHIADVDSEPVSDRNLLSMIMSPKKDIDKILEKMGKSQDTESPAAEAPIPEPTTESTDNQS